MTPSREEIVVYLSFAAADFLLAKTQRRKEIVVHLSALDSCLSACRSPLRLSYFASYSFFFLLAKTQSRKEIVVCSV
jgi:hypothetical protein